MPKAVFREQDIPFRRDDANRFLPWIIAVMVALAGLMLLLGITVGQGVERQTGDFSRRFSVHLPAAEASADKIEKVNALLNAREEVESARREDEAVLRARLSPWLGGLSSLDGLPLPIVFSVTLKREQQAADLSSLEKDLRGIAPGASVDAQALWAEKFRNLSATVQWSLYLLALFVAGMLSAMIVFTSRAAMKLHERTVLLLHSIGAPDGYIARQFQTNAWRVTLLGAVPGTLTALALYGFFAAYVSTLDAPLLPNLQIGGAHVALALILPLLCASIARFSARLSALNQLQELP